MKNEKSKVFFVSFSQANLCRGGGGARRPTKIGRHRRRLFDTSSIRSAATRSRVAEWCMRRFASKDEIHHVSQENSGVRAGAFWPLVQRPDIILGNNQKRVYPVRLESKTGTAWNQVKYTLDEPRDWPKTNRTRFSEIMTRVHL